MIQYKIDVHNSKAHSLGDLGKAYKPFGLAYGQFYEQSLAMKCEIDNSSDEKLYQHKKSFYLHLGK
jgi:hypothetical protein